MNGVAVQGPEDLCVIGLDMQTVEGQRSSLQKASQQESYSTALPVAISSPFCLHPETVSDNFPYLVQLQFGLIWFTPPSNTRTHC